jgi:hypothetical protein
VIFMPSKLQCAGWCALSILLVSSAIRVDAGIRPSFDLDGCSWNATHIVLVNTTAQDGVFSISESWKGDLKPGESVAIPELKPNESALAISRYPKDWYSQNNWEATEQIPRQPVGSRMILFLKKKQESGAGAPVNWEPVGQFGGWKVSTLWIDDGKAFCFQQWENPGPSTLSPCIRNPVRSSQVDVFTARIKEVLKVQTDLSRVLGAKNSEVRAHRLGYIALGDVYPAQKEAMEALGKSGTVALPAILQIMDKPPGFYDGKALIQMLVDAAGKESGKQLHARLKQDVIYWETVGPTLTPDWLGQVIEVGSPLFVKFSETSLLLGELENERYAPAAETVAELRTFWVSQPQLYDAKWGERDLRSGGSVQEMIQSSLFNLATQCDAFAKRVGAP